MSRKGGRVSSATKVEEVPGISAILSALNEKMELVLKEVAEMRTALEQTQELRAAHEELYRKVRAIDSDLAKAEKSVYELQQDGLANDVEISGLQQVPGEDLNQTVGTILVSLGLEELLKDVDYVYRKRTEGKGAKLPAPPVIVRFIRRSSVSALLAKKVRNADLTSLGLPSTSTGKCFVNAHLTQRNKYLLHVAKEQVRHGSIKFAWFAGGAVLIRKEEGSKVVRVKEVADIVQFDLTRKDKQPDE